MVILHRRYQNVKKEFWKFGGRPNGYTSRAACELWAMRLEPLFYAINKYSWNKFLVDVGAEVIVIPHHSGEKSMPSALLLWESNGTKRKTYRTRNDILKHQDFLWDCIQTHVKTPIMEANVLAYFNRSHNLHMITLSENNTYVKDAYYFQFDRNHFCHGNQGTHYIIESIAKPYTGTHKTPQTGQWNKQTVSFR